jgi:hypothetical protein
MFRIAERLRCARGRVGRFSLAAALAAVALAAFAGGTSAAPLSFTLFNPSGSNQSRLDLTAKIQLSGTPVDDAQIKAQVDPIPLITLGSMTTLYNDTASNDSKVLANVTQQSITFGGGSTAVASNGTSTILGPLQIAPAVGGGSGTAPANYGFFVTVPQNIALPAIDLNPLGIDAMLNLGTLTAIDLKVAMRDVVIDVEGPAGLPLSPAGTPPPTQFFDSSALEIGISGTTDMLLGATVTSNNLVDKAALHLALNALNGVLGGQGIALTFSTPNIFSLQTTIGFGFSTPLPTTFAANDDATNGMLEHIGANYRLTIPVKFDVVPETLPAPLDTFFTAQLGLSGKLIGQTPFQILEVPEPSSIVLALVAIVGLAGVGLRARRRAA